MNTWQTGPRDRHRERNTRWAGESEGKQEWRHDMADLSLEMSQSDAADCVELEAWNVKTDTWNKISF